MSDIGLLSPDRAVPAGRAIGEAMQVIVMASQKGGSGKTTLTGHIAVEASRAGDGPVAIIDTDPQGSLAGWGRARESAEPAIFTSTSDELPDVLVRLRNERYRLVFIDTPPAVTTLISDVVMLSDLVVIPTRPSPHDLRAVGATVDIIESHGRNMVFVVNSATPRARITADAAVALSQHGTVAPVTLHHRVDYAASMIDGRTVMEVSEKSRSAKEIVALWKYLADRLDRIAQEAATVPAPIPEPVAMPTPALAATGASTSSANTGGEVRRASFPAHGPADVHRRFAPTFGRRTQ